MGTGTREVCTLKTNVIQNQTASWGGGRVCSAWGVGAWPLLQGASGASRIGRVRVAFPHYCPSPTLSRAPRLALAFSTAIETMK